MSEKQQFDEFLGGSEKLPRDAHVIKLATARASEIAAMNYKLDHPSQTKLIFQKLPVHMRRRVMSHNAKRMPRKLRNGHLSQMIKSGLPPKTKRPSRKYRRRPKNLLLEYNRRQRNKFWLETHIWHAKRFKMIEKWGFKLADHSNDRCFRASYRAVTNHCLIQDISYYTCLEIEGPVDMLKEKLKMHCNPNEVTFAAKAYISGEREGTVMFYKKNGYPSDPIGYVHFLWKPNNPDTKAIWIWVHPAFYSEVLDEITSNFNFELHESKGHIDIESEASQEKMKNEEKEIVAPALKIFMTTKIPTYSNPEGCKLTILRNCLNRFRLCGPLALSILTDAFKLPNINSRNNTLGIDAIIIDDEEIVEKQDSEEKKDEWQMDVDTNDKSDHSIDTWFHTYYESQDNMEVFKIQRDVYNNFRSLNYASQLPPNMVLALTVLDPRFFLPHKRTKSVQSSEVGGGIPMPPTSSNKSPLWDLNVRNYVTRNCISATAIHKLRSQNLVPGVENDQFFNEDIMHKIPILLIQKPGDSHNSLDFGSGIDIVFPTGWAVPFWLALIMRCARPGGLRESKSIAYESSNLNVPTINHPDTKAYRVEAEEEKLRLTQKYFKLPPNKRTNYIKFGISSPFFCEWNMLVKEWTGVDTFYVLRDYKILSILGTKLCQDLERKRKIAKKEGQEDRSSQDVENFIENKNCLVPVRVTAGSKGLSKDFSIICLPTEEDLAKYKEDKKWCGPVESFKVDPNEEKRKTLRKEHIASLKRLRKQRVRAKKKIENEGCNMPIENTEEVKHFNKLRDLVKKKLGDSNKTLIDNQAQMMSSLYLPKCTGVRHSCDREVIGYVTQGGFSLSEAKGVGLGYIVLLPAINLIKEKTNMVLTRNPTTRKYRICKIEILY
ncbi:ribonucleases P/MRP protein subunit POP1 [Nasonia vitripennis]|uniref:Uncharacterized protein n=1 Tax=Nasonia vitripennis TaxID=7425 RepID=A0A7M7ITF3_NASVI|nr:ribonucleases P/MRP protein subunit POP1 [Nasonia vitripennis]